MDFLCASSPEEGQAQEIRLLYLQNLLVREDLRFQYLFFLLHPFSLRQDPLYLRAAQYCHRLICAEKNNSYQRLLEKYGRLRAHIKIQG